MIKSDEQRGDIIHELEKAADGERKFDNHLRKCAKALREEYIAGPRPSDVAASKKLIRGTIKEELDAALARTMN